MKNKKLLLPFNKLQKMTVKKMVSFGVGRGLASAIRKKYSYKKLVDMGYLENLKDKKEIE